MNSNKKNKCEIISNIYDEFKRKNTIKEIQRNNKGISLIVLIISIIVMIILATAIVLSILNDNPSSSAKQAKFVNDVRQIQGEVDIYVSKILVDKMGSLDYRKIDGAVEVYAPNTTFGTEYINILSVVDGRVVVSADATPEYIVWANEIGISSTDITVPENPSITANTYLPTNQNLTITITYPIDAVSKEYSLNEGVTWLSYTTPYTLTENKKILARCRDLAGNQSGQSELVITNIDKVAPVNPEVTHSPMSPTNGSVTVTINYPSDASTKEYSLNDGETWQTYTAEFGKGTNGTVLARATDNAGNVSDVVSHEISNIDVVAPENPTPVASTYDWTNADVTISITYPSDANTKEYSIDGGTNWSTYTVPFTISTNKTIIARCYDIAGNPSGEGSTTVTKIDKVAPTVSVSNPSPSQLIVGSTVSLIVTYSGQESVSLTSGNVTLNGFTGTINVSGTGNSRTISISNVQTAGSNKTITIASGTASDLAGNVTQAITSNGFIILSETATINGTEVNRPDISQFDPATTYYVYFNGSNNLVESQVSTNSEPAEGVWYDYSPTAKKWANIKTTSNGVTSYWVWIPRYAYEITTYRHQSTTGAGIINIKFMRGTSFIATDGTTIRNGFSVDSNGIVTGITFHPAFRFGSADQVKGIWVAKFEASSTNSKVQVVSNVSTWRNIQLVNAFNACRNMESSNGSIYKSSAGEFSYSTTYDGSYGNDISITKNGLDSHLMKNTEWGAVAYLTESSYGKNSEVSKNTNSSYITASSWPGTMTTSYSTTGNAYGVYDMSGGTEEITMANYNSTVGNSGFTSVSGISGYYWEWYGGSNYGYNGNNYGDAVIETAGSAAVYIGGSIGWSGDGSAAWYNDNTWMPTAWFLRGDRYNALSDVAGIYAFDSHDGSALDGVGFRPVVVVAPGI